MGQNNVNNGNTSFVLGSTNINEGQRSILAGFNSKNTGVNSLIVGYHSENLEADNAIIVGDYIKNLGANSAVFGDGVKASNVVTLHQNSGKCSLLGGFCCSNSGNYSLIAGNQQSNTGAYATVLGNQNTNSAESVLVTGASNYNSGKFSLVSGSANKNSGTTSLVAGNQNYNLGSYATVMGRLNKNGATWGFVSGGGLNNGEFTENEDGTFNVVTAGVSGSAVFGKYNNFNSTAIFTVGTGTSNEKRSNALEILTNGTINIYKTPAITSTSIEAVRGVDLYSYVEPTFSTLRQYNIATGELQVGANLPITEFYAAKSGQYDEDKEEYIPLATLYPYSSNTVEAQVLIDGTSVSIIFKHDGYDKTVSFQGRYTNTSTLIAGTLKSNSDATQLIKVDTEHSDLYFNPHASTLTATTYLDNIHIIINYDVEYGEAGDPTSYDEIRISHISISGVLPYKTTFSNQSFEMELSLRYREEELEKSWLPEFSVSDSNGWSKLHYTSYTGAVLSLL